MPHVRHRPVQPQGRRRFRRSKVSIASRHKAATQAIEPSGAAEGHRVIQSPSRHKNRRSCGQEAADPSRGIRHGSDSIPQGMPYSFFSKFTRGGQFWGHAAPPENSLTIS